VKTATSVAQLDNGPRSRWRSGGAARNPGRDAQLACCSPAARQEDIRRRSQRAAAEADVSGARRNWLRERDLKRSRTCSPPTPARRSERRCATGGMWRTTASARERKGRGRRGSRREAEVWRPARRIDAPCAARRRRRANRHSREGHERRTWRAGSGMSRRNCGQGELIAPRTPLLVIADSRPRLGQRLRRRALVPASRWPGGHVFTDAGGRESRAPSPSSRQKRVTRATYRRPRSGRNSCSA